MNINPIYSYGAYVYWTQSTISRKLLKMDVLTFKTVEQ